MERESFTPTERAALWALAGVGFVVVNGAFAYGAFFRKDAFVAALTNPVSAAFIAEAVILVGVLAYGLRRWGATRMHWGWFVLLSLVGGLLFSVPLALLQGPPRNR